MPVNINEQYICKKFKIKKQNKTELSSADSTKNLNSATLEDPLEVIRKSKNESIFHFSPEISHCKVKYITI